MEMAQPTRHPAPGDALITPVALLVWVLGTSTSSQERNENVHNKEKIRQLSYMYLGKFCQ